MARIRLISNDLIFSTKIKGTAEQIGVAIEIHSRIDNKPSPDVERILIDLSAPATTGADLARLRENFPTPVQLVAFGSHVDVARLKEARQAGCDLVLPRSAFVQRIVALVNPSEPIE